MGMISGVVARFVAWVALAIPGRRFDAGPMPIDQAVRTLWARYGGVYITRAEALSVPAVMRGRNLICGSLGALPLVQRNAAREPVHSTFLEQIDPDVPNVVTLAQTFEDLLFEAIGWWEVTAKGADRFPLHARRLDPATVSLDPPAGRRAAPLPSGWDPRDVPVYVDGRVVPSSRIIRFDSPNPGVLANGGARCVKRALLLDALAAMYAEDPRPMDYFTAADGVDPAGINWTQILDDWRALRKSRATGYVPAAVKYNTVDSPSPVDLQLVELQKQAALDVTNLIGVDPEDVGVSTTSRTYANITDRRTQRINDVYRPFLAAVEQRLSMGDVTPRGNTVAFNLAAYLRPDPVTRWTVYGMAAKLEAITVPEIREMEEWPVMDGEPAAAPVSAVPAGDDADEQAAKLRAFVGFAADSARHTFDVDLSTFTVDTGKRTVAGVIVPWNRQAKGYRFARGSVKWSDVARVKLLRDHNPREILGKAVKLTDRPDGLHGEFLVGDGPERDAALQDAADGLLDGFSIGVDFGNAGDVTEDPKMKGGWLVVSAALRETSLTGIPAFDDARLTSVKMMEGNMPEEPVLATTEPAPAALPATFTVTPEQIGSMLSAAMAGAGIVPARQTLQIPTAEPAAAAGPTPVSPANGIMAGAVVLSNAATYRFDRRGNLIAGTHDFGADFIAATRDGDKQAGERVMAFVRERLDPGTLPETMAMAARSGVFDVITTDVDELNPTRQRPEMWVPQRSFKYPIWDAIYKGTLTDITPFTFPKYNSSSGLVGAHTQGTEPSSGTYTVTGQTVTPTARSGKIKVSREVWDQGGNPQVGNLIWGQMVKAFYEALEAAAVTELNAASPTSLGTLTAGGGTTGQTLARELKRYLAALHFVRGGFSMTDAFTQIDLYMELVEAESSDGRAIFPQIGPSNADGTISNRYSSVNVGGVDFLPAWALAATGSVAASSYLFDRDCVWGWATAPTRLTIDSIEVANVYIGLWAYVATAISDINGVREMIYDPVP